MCGSILHMWTKISDDWSKTMTCIVENVTISFKHEYRRLNLTSRCDIISDVSSVNNTFSVRICDYLFISDIKLRPEVSQEVEYVISIAFPTFCALDRCSSLNIKGVMAISKFDLPFKVMTSLFDLWTRKIIGFCTDPWSLSVSSLVICWSLRELSHNKQTSKWKGNQRLRTCQNLLIWCSL